MTHDQDQLEQPARESLREVLAHIPRRTLGKVGMLLALLAAVLFFRSRADTVVRLLGPAGLQPTRTPAARSTEASPTGRENRHQSGGEGVPRDSVPSSAR
jgi:hypothetical protein